MENTEKIYIRPAASADAQELLNIYAPYVQKTAITFEYTVPAVSEFAARIDNTMKFYPYFVAEINRKIAGYAYAGAFKGRAAYDWSVETTVYVDEGYKRCGIGKALYDTLEAALKAQGILNMNACIAYTENEDKYLTADSVHFHEKSGFHPVGVFHKCGCKFGYWYDMIWMEKHIGAHCNNPKPVIPFTDTNFKI